MKIIARLFVFGLTIAYPFLVYWGIAADQQTLLLGVLAGLLGLRLLLVNSDKERWALLVMAAVLLIILWTAGSESSLKLYPVLMNLGLLFVFGSSLFAEKTVVERLARIREPDLPEHAVLYTRQVTQAWCMFFALNALMASLTVFADNEQLWLWYNGVIAYVLIGVMFVGEWLIRQRVRAQQK